MQIEVPLDDARRAFMTAKCKRLRELTDEAQGIRVELQAACRDWLGEAGCVGDDWQFLENTPNGPTLTGHITERSHP